MRNSETGEYELVMGNRQLLSGFFIVALLFGVAFAMGYIVGRNSSPARTQAEVVQAPIPSEPARPPAVIPPAPAASEPAKPEAAAPAAPPAGVQTAPAVEPAAVRDPAKAEEPAPPSPNAADIAPGTYWQVIAVAQPEAESVRKVLREKNFQVVLSPGSKNLTRVIVGPYPDRESLGKAKADLENAGFHPIVLRR